MYTSRYPSRKFYLKFFGGRLAITPKAFASLRFRGALSGNAQRRLFAECPSVGEGMRRRRTSFFWTIG